MTRKLKFKGKDVEEAINTAVEKMKVPREQLDIAIESPGSDGIFGLCRKSAVIYASLKEPVRDTAEEEGESVAEEEQADQVEATEKKVVPEEDKSSEADRQARSEAPAPFEDKGRKLETGEGPLPQEIQDHLKSDLKQLLELMTMPSEVEFREADGKTVLYISGESEQYLTADKGQLLDSLEYLLGRMAGRKYPQRLAFSLDAGDFRASRKAELEELALKLTAEVKETGKTRTISPLNPSERRIVHMLLQQDTTIRSRSVGNGLFKKILIYLPGKTRKQRKQKAEG